MSIFEKFKRGAGFTLIELLVVVAIIGVLMSIILVTLGNARLKSRDARRMTDISQIRSGLDVYFNLGAGYPSTADWNAAQVARGQISCGGTPALLVPQDPMNNADATFSYAYTQGLTGTVGCGGTVYNDYKILFKTEGDTGVGPAGYYWLSGSKGITPVGSPPF